MKVFFFEKQLFEKLLMSRKLCEEAIIATIVT